MGAPNKIFAIGDVHGCATELRLLLNKLPLDKDSRVVFLGDYVDRGPQSREVIDTVLELSKEIDVVPLKGNHEALFLAFLRDPGSEAAGMFIYNGGSATLHSYAGDDGEYHIPREHRDFLANLELFHETDDYFFVHAGCPRIPVEQFDTRKHAHDFLWARGAFLRTNYKWSKLIVHGHTPVKAVDMRANRINIDTACVFDRTLTAVELPAKRFYSVRRQDKTRHVYLRDRSESLRDAQRFVGSVPVYVHRDDEVLEFETRDYSEFGMLLRGVAHLDRAILDQEERISGFIGSQDESLVDFDGEVVRVDPRADGVYYGIKLLRLGAPQ
jgi:serine/threonine protein phosphatase 1